MWHMAPAHKLQPSPLLQRPGHPVKPRLQQLQPPAQRAAAGLRSAAAHLLQRRQPQVAAQAALPAGSVKLGLLLQPASAGARRRWPGAGDGIKRGSDVAGQLLLRQLLVQQLRCAAAPAPLGVRCCGSSVCGCLQAGRQAAGDVAEAAGKGFA